MGYNVGKGLSESLKKTRDDVSTGATDLNPANVVSDAKTAISTTVDAEKARATKLKDEELARSKENITRPLIETTIRPTLDGIKGIQNKMAWVKEKYGEHWQNVWDQLTAAGDVPGLNIPKVGQGVGGPGGAGGGGPTGPVQIQAINGQGGVGGSGNGEFRAGQLTLAQQLAQQAAGTGPSVAGEQLKQSQAANQAATFAQLASARGGANPALARQAMQTSAQIQGQTAKDSALARLQEQMNAQNTLGAVLNTGRAGDLGQDQLSQEGAIAQAGLGQQYEELKQKYSQQGQNAEIANQLASIEMEKIMAGQPAPVSPLMQGLGQASTLISSIYGR